MNRELFPHPTRIVIPIKQRDDQFFQLQQLIDAKRQFLIDKQKKLYVLKKQNQFLDAVKSDYQKYNGYIQQQKKDQIRALNVLDEYIRDLTLSGKLTKHNIEDAKAEQAKILREVKHIKHQLDSVVDDTEKLTNN